jgi:type I restriction enzyme S subunit
MDKENKNIPQIRFPEFEGEWECRRLGEIIKVHSFKPYIAEPSNNGRYEVIQQGNDAVIGYADGKPFANYKSIVLFGDHTLSLYKPINPFFIATDGIKILDTIDNFDGYFFYSILEKYKPQSEGYKRHFSILKEQECFYTSNKIEQQKIGLYFKQLDNLISLSEQELNGYKELKKCMLQKMFPKEGERVPEIRFPGFEGDWEYRRLGEICEKVTRKNTNNISDLPLTIASQHGLIDQRDFFNKVVAAKDMSNYYLLKKGEFAYNKSYSNGFDYGTIKRLNAYEQGCLSPLYICFGITSNDVDSDYLECFFDTLKWYGNLSMICTEGARNHGLLNVDTKGFFDELMIDLPIDIEEQKKIATYFKSIDNLISLSEQELNEYKRLKKCMLQKMFC